MRARDFTRENINFYDRFGHDNTTPDETMWQVSFADGEDVVRVRAKDKQQAIRRATVIAKSQGNPYPSVDWVKPVKEGVAEGSSDYFRRREREEAIISGQKPARKKQPAQTSDYAKRREQEKKQGVAEGKKHISPSGVETNMDPEDDDYDVNYGREGGVAKFRKSQGLDVRTGSKKIKEQGVAEGVTQDFFNKNFSQIDSVIKQNPKKILDLLVGMFPSAKEAIVNQYNDEEGMPFSEWRRVIYDIDDYMLSGPVVVNGARLPIDPESEADRLAKYQQYIQDKDSGRPARYFRANDSDPRTIDFSKLPPITIAQTDRGMVVTDGNHRAFLAKMANKPLRAYVWKRQSNNHPNVAKIKALFSNQQGVAEGFMDTLKGAARELTRDSMQKKIKQAWENTFWPKHIEPALNRIQIDGQPFRRMVLGEPRVIENDRSKNAILKQYTVNIVFPIDPDQWAGDEIRYLQAQLHEIENGAWNPKVHGLGLVSFDQPMKSFQYTKGPVPDLVIPVRITSLDINRSLVGEQGVVEDQLDSFRLERLDPQTRRVLQRMADHKEPGSWLSASEAHAMQLGLQYKNRDPRGWEQDIQRYVDLYKEVSGNKA
jgi:hypothetical protein